MIRTETISSIVQQHSGTPLFGEALSAADSPAKLLRILALYAEFNFDFGPSIAALAAQIAGQRSSFVDRNAPVFQDRSYEVAAGIFNAAVDEFGGRSKKRPTTHRNMVQQMVLCATRYFSVEPSVIAEMLRAESPALTPLLNGIPEGYGVGKHLDLEATFRAIGFHLGQELCGADEFKTLNDVMRRDHVGLVEFLREHHALAWVTVHLTAEDDHFDQAIRSAARAFEFCTSEQTEVLERCMLEGVESFARFQAACMRQLALPLIEARASSAVDHPS